MFCTSCGAKNSEDGIFCKKCGSGIDKPITHKISELDYERAMPEDERVTALLERAYRARKDGDRVTAISICEEALSLRPNSTTCHSLLGQLYEQGGELPLAIAQYEAVLALNPGSIADRVKLDELRGAVPALASSVEKRALNHVILADTSKQSSRTIDYRLPSMVFGGLALMALGGILTMQIINHQNAIRHSGGTDGLPTAIAGANGANNSSRVDNSPHPQNGSVNSQTPINGGTPVTGTAANGSANSGAVGTSPNNMAGQYIGSTQPPIIIKTQPPIVRIESPRTTALSPASVINSNGGQVNGGRNSESGDEIPSDHVRLGSGDSSASTAETKSRGSGTVTKAPVDYVLPHKGSIPGTSTGENGSAASQPIPASDSRMNSARGNALSQQGQYKQAASAYLKALDGSGDDMAYMYRRAAWCFEQAGDKNTAVSYYQHAIDEAQKLVNAGHQVEIAKNIILVSQTGIRACSN